jgi:transcriptional regulator with XRE-family HTH domain
VSASITIGLRLLKARTRQRLSLTAAAVRLSRLCGLGVSRGLVHHWEHGRVPSRRYLAGIAAFTGRGLVELERLRRRQVRTARAARDPHPWRRRIGQPARPAGGVA